MSKGSKITYQSSRPGEGTIVRLQLDPEKTKTGASQFVTMDFSSVPVPDRRYAADTLGVRTLNGAVKLVFGQCPLDDIYQSLVVINLSKAGLKNTLSVFESMKNPSLADIASSEGISVGTLTLPKILPTQSVTLSANFAMGAVSGEDAAIDFFRSSPFAMSAAQRSGNLAIDPVVRVEMSTGLLLGLLEELRRISALQKD